MGLRADQVYQAGLALDLDERALVAHRLLASLHVEDEADTDTIDAAWRDVIGARVDEILRGDASLTTFEQTRAKARALLDDLR